MNFKNKKEHIPMLKDEKTTYKRKRFPLVVLILVVALGGAAYVWQANSEMPKAEAAEVATVAVDKLLNAESLRYRTESLLEVNDQEICYGTIEGEKGSPDTYHAWGNILGSDVDIYQIGNTTYRLDEITRQWVEIPNNDLTKASMLIAELDPAANFHFDAIGTVSYLEDEVIDGTKTYKLSVEPVLSDEWIKKYFTNIRYTLWVEQKTGYLLQALITADTENNGTKGTLKIFSEFSDYGGDFEIQAPTNAPKTAKSEE